MKEQNLEKRICDLKDWVPIYGIFNIFKRLEKIPEEMIENKKFEIYLFSNSIYNCFSFYYLLVYPIMSKYLNKFIK